MANTVDEKSLTRNRDLDAFVQITILAWVLFTLALTDVDDSSEESFLDELVRTVCMMFSIGTVVFFLLSELYARMGGSGVLVATLIGLAYMLRNHFIDMLYNLIGRPFGVDD